MGISCPAHTLRVYMLGERMGDDDDDGGGSADVLFAAKCETLTDLHFRSKVCGGGKGQD